MKAPSSDRWLHVNQMLDAVLDQEPRQREGFLRKHCSDPGIRREVESLLKEVEAADAAGFLDRPIHLETDALYNALSDVAQAAEEEPFADFTGRQVGPYRIERMLGRGGMGAVFLARRADGEYEQQVALKIMRRDVFQREDLVARLRRERQILASLDHEHVARLLDGGVDDEGRPYLVMEYIDGEPLDAYCDRRSLDIGDRLRLFKQVGEAVAAAHRRAVIHRDLKPSNILIQERDVGANGETVCKPQAKLLDFGIAKLIESDEIPKDAPLTRTGMTVMTPEYAAPEQIRGTDVTTATDVYQLGVVLYELLTGQRPFHDTTNGTSGRAHLRALEEAILSTDPKRPSTAVTRLDNEVTRRTRNADPVQLARRLQGDLDAICLKALRKEPGSRYLSVDAFMEDVARYLDGRPVEARRGTAWYRMQKFARRHWKGVVTGLAFIVVLVGGGVFYTTQVSAERDRAEMEAQKAEEVTEFLVGLFDVSDPYSTEAVSGDTLTARLILERGADRASRELAGQPVIQATMLAEIGRIYTGLGFFSEAEALLQEAVGIHEGQHNKDSLNIADPLLYLSRLRYDQGDYEAAETLARKAVRLRAGALSQSPLDLAKSLNNLGVVLERRGSYDEAENQYSQALTVLRREYGSSHIEVSKALTNLALLQEKRGEYASAESLYTKSIAIKEKSLPAGHPHLANSYNLIGELYREQGRYQAAEEYQRRALAAYQASFRDDHPQVAISANDLAITLENQGKLREADSLLRKALEIKVNHFGEKSSTVATSLNNLAIILRKQKKYAEAEEMHRRVLALDREIVGNNHRWIATDLNEIATVLAQQGKLDEAEQLFRESLVMRQQLLGSEHPHVGFSLGNLGEILVEKGKLEQAEPLLLESYGILKEGTDRAHNSRQTALKRIIRLYEQMDKSSQVQHWKSQLKAHSSSQYTLSKDM